MYKEQVTLCFIYITSVLDLILPFNFDTKILDFTYIKSACVWHVKSPLWFQFL